MEAALQQHGYGNSYPPIKELHFFCRISIKNPLGVLVTLEKKDRKAWVDIAKGLGIIAVVIGHSGSSIAHLLYWFHMPLFFVISGFLFKPIADWITLYAWANRRARQLLIPYISFLGLLVIVEFYLNNKYIGLHEISGILSQIFSRAEGISVGFILPFGTLPAL